MTRVEVFAQKATEGKSFDMFRMKKAGENSY